MNKKYSVIVRGENFILEIEGRTNTYGFVTTRNVKAFSIDGSDSGQPHFKRIGYARPDKRNFL